MLLDALLIDDCMYYKFRLFIISSTQFILNLLHFFEDFGIHGTYYLPQGGLDGLSHILPTCDLFVVYSLQEEVQCELCQVRVLCSSQSLEDLAQNI